MVDASVILSWCFPDEHSEVAEKVAGMFREGARAVAPSFFPHEIVNALLFAEKRKRVSRQMVQSFLDDVRILPVDLRSLELGDAVRKIHLCAVEYGLTAYDAAYLTIAIDESLPLATIDNGLIRACKQAGGMLLQP